MNECQNVFLENVNNVTLYLKNTMKILFAIAPLFLSMSVEASVYFGPPDGENIIDIGSKDGYLFKVENGIYVRFLSRNPPLHKPKTSNGRKIVRIARIWTIL